MWAHDAVFYQVYPLGMCGAPPRNDFASSEPRLAQLFDWLPHWESLGIDALYLGPVWESTAHGYDTADYFHVDRRLGDDRLLADLSWALHAKGIRLVLDGVFHHVGRDFWAFRDVQKNGQSSPYCGWFFLRFGEQSSQGDPFSYENWHGAEDLVKLNLSNPEVRQHLFQAVESWIRDYGIDGLRLDASDCIDRDFLKELARLCRRLKPDFWLMGEAVFGNYNLLANPEMLDATTNYEAYKGLHSSHNDRNLFEIAHSLDRQFGPSGVYRNLHLYSFADNHDVDRIGELLKDSAHLYPLHVLLFGMPGIPAIYAGSEWGIGGKIKDGGQAALRPFIPYPGGGPHSDLEGAIAKLSRIRRETPSLRRGDFKKILVCSEQFAFSRQTEEETAIVLVNISKVPVRLELSLPVNGKFHDRLNPRDSFFVQGGKITLEMPANWGRILVSQKP
ncbi:MAG TPA: alpha-amylase [Cyanobacteria bacterium UBA8530]|nr:alpha-amylase [Cyanobacteria bacterium UBA8530]